MKKAKNKPTKAQKQEALDSGLPMKIGAKELLKRRLILLGKISFTVFAFYVLANAADFSKIFGYMKAIPPQNIVAAFLFLLLAQMTSALRMRYYFANENVHFNRKYSISLYLLGSLVNHILPGGIGGDGYKAFLIRQHFSFPFLSAVRLILSSRVNGLLALAIITLVLLYFSKVVSVIPYGDYFITFLIFLTIPTYSIAVKILFKEPISIQLGASKYSFVVQGFVMMCVMMLLYGFGLSHEMADYLALFMVSCVVSVLPISLGGVGLRELTFFYAADYIGLNAELGVAIAMLYFVINLLLSLTGLIFFYRLKSPVLAN